MGGSWVGITGPALQLLEDCEVAATAAGKEANNEQSEGWNTWVDQAFTKGARPMHRWTRLHQLESQPTALSNGVPTANKQVVVDTELVKLTKVWQADDNPRNFSTPDRRALPRPAKRRSELPP